MGTNYYWHKNPCEKCGRSDESLHIGKSSAGWCFALHIIPYENIYDLSGWKQVWENEIGKIFDEYGRELTTNEMLEIITKRSWPKKERNPKFLEENHAEPGPNNLMRHRLGPHCAKHGEGTWDCIEGEFS